MNYLVFLEGRKMENNNNFLAFQKAYDFLLSQDLTNKPILEIDSEKLIITLNESKELK